MAIANYKVSIKTLAARHRHAMHFVRSSERGTFARALFYRAYRCSRIALQAGICETSETSSGFFGEAYQALKNRGFIQEVRSA